MRLDLRSRAAEGGSADLSDAELEVDVRPGQTVREECESAELGAGATIWGVEMVVELLDSIATEVRGGAEYLRKKIEWDRRAKSWLDLGVADPRVMQLRRDRARDAFQAGARFLDGGMRPGEQLRRVLSSVFENNVYPRTRLDLPVPLDMFPEAGGCAVGTPLLFAWNRAMNEYPGCWGMVERCSEADCGFGRILEDVSRAIRERVDGPFCKSPERYGLNTGSALSALNAVNPAARGRALSEFQALHIDRIRAGVQAVSDLVVLTEVLEALGGDREVVEMGRNSAARGALFVSEAAYLLGRVEQRVVALSASSLSNRCAEALREVPKGFPGFKNVIGIRSRSTCRYLVVDMQAGQGKSFRIFLDRTKSNLERIERLTDALRKNDAYPRSGYAAMNYRRKSEGDLDDRAVINYLTRSAVWSPGDDSPSRVLGLIPEATAGEDLVAVLPSDGVGLRAYLLPAALVQMVNYLATPNRVALSGYRPDGRFVTFYQGEDPVAHGWAKPEIVENVPFGESAIRIAKDLLGWGEA